jgi:hypothetical protein
MKRLSTFSILILSAAMLAACASPQSVYAPAMKTTDVGWRQQQIEADRYRVSFRGYSDLGASGAEDKALRRAAEIAVQNGYDWFRVVSRGGDQSGRKGGGTSVGVGGSSGSFGSGVGVGVGIDLSPDTRTFESVLEVLFGKGAKPSDPDAYDAKSILGRVG